MKQGNKLKIKNEEENQAYATAESLYQSLKAKKCGFESLAYEIAQTTDGFAALSLSKGIKSVPSWDKKEKLATMKMVVSLKAQQNIAVRDEVSLIKGSIFEATYDSFWGCQLPMSRHNYT